MKNIIRNYYIMRKMYGDNNNEVGNNMKNIAELLKRKLFEVNDNISNSLTASKYELLIIISILKELSNVEIDEIDEKFNNMYADLNLNENVNEFYSENENGKISIKKSAYYAQKVKNSVKKNIVKGTSYSLSKISKVMKR